MPECVRQHHSTGDSQDDSAVDDASPTGPRQRPKVGLCTETRGLAMGWKTKRKGQRQCSSGQPPLASCRILFVRHVDVLAITDLLVCLSGGRPTASAFTAASPLALSPPPATTPEAAPDAPEDTTEAERQQQVEEEQKEQQRVVGGGSCCRHKSQRREWRGSGVAYHACLSDPANDTFALPEKAAREGVEDPEGACNAHDFDGVFIRNTVAWGHNAISPRILATRHLRHRVILCRVAHVESFAPM
jgi:hypothetical protein